MAGTIFTYHEGYLRVGFRPDHYGDFLIDIKVSADAVSETAVDDNCQKGGVSTHLGDDLQVVMATSPTVSRFFGDMIRWLEAMIIGVQECAFEWDNEGPEGRLHWHNHWDGRGLLHLTWDGSRERPIAVDRRFLLVREEVVRAFYEALRSMTASAAYARLEHEPVTVGECLDMILDASDRQRFSGILAAMDRDTATRLVDALLAHAHEGRLGPPRILPLGGMIERMKELTPPHDPDPSTTTGSHWLSDDWDGMPAEDRLAEIESLYAYQAWYAPGERLAELRSEAIEQWLAREVAAAAMRG